MLYQSRVGDMSDFGEMRRVKTTKWHRCEWCGQGIPKGTRCVNYRGLFDNCWQNWYMHLECEENYSLTCDPSEGFSPYDNERPQPENVS